MSRDDEPLANDGLTLKTLCEESGVAERTVRYYMQQGLIAPAARSGPGVRYPAANLARLRLIRRWQEEFLPLEQIRKMLSGLSDAEVVALAERPAPRSPRRESAADYVRAVLGKDVAPAAEPQSHTRSVASSAPRAADATPRRSQWERFVVDDDVEVHVRRPLSHVTNRRVEALLAEAKRIFQKEPDR